MNKDDIKYLTLIELGYNTKPEFINSEDNGVNLINDQYDFVMNLALTSYNWSFATKQVELTGELNTNNNKYKYQYFLPEDVLFVRGVYGDDKFRSSIKDFEIYDKRVFNTFQTISKLMRHGLFAAICNIWIAHFE